MNKYLTLVFFTTLLLLNNIVLAQCNKDSKVLEMKKGRDNIPRFSNDGSYEAYDQCIRYYQYVCQAKADHYTKNGKEYPRTEQDARMIEDAINKSIDSYNRINVKKCGELESVKAVFSVRIENRKENVVGYWITEDKIGERLNYTEFYFGNDNVFNISLRDSSLERATWEKTRENSYRISYSYYDTWYKKWTDPVITSFEIDTTSSTATYHFKDNKGNPKTSKWYFKGTAYNLYGISREKLLQPENCNVK